MHKVLLVDDDQVCNFIHDSVIKTSGVPAETITCISAVKALELLNKMMAENLLLPELILLDINMPVMDGFEFLEEFSKFEIESVSQVKILMLTSSLNDEDVRKALSYPFVKEFISKPLTKNKFVDLMEKWF